MSWFDRSVKCPVCRADIRSAPVTAAGAAEAAGTTEAPTPNLDID